MENKEKNFMSAVVYVHNAEKRIEDFLKMIIDVLEENFVSSEIICVNDFSTDSSVEIIKKVSDFATETTITIVNMSCFHGVELAMNAGVDLAIGDFVLEFDSTVQDYEKTELMKVYKKALEGYDIVSASANKKQKFSSDLFYKLYDRHADAARKIGTESFRVLSRRVINRISSMNKTIPYRKAVYANCGLKATNLKYEAVSLKEEKQTLDKKEKKYRKTLAIDTLILFTDVGYRFSVTMTMLMMLISVVVVIYSVVIYIVSEPVAGWTTTILFMSLAFFGLFGILTVIIRYLEVMISLIFKRQQYSFESIEKMTK